MRKTNKGRSGMDGWGLEVGGWRNCVSDQAVVGAAKSLVLSNEL